MSAGLTGESIAREFGVSERTIARRIGRLQQALDAQTGFQLGVQASRRPGVQASRRPGRAGSERPTGDRQPPSAVCANLLRSGAHEVAPGHYPGCVIEMSRADFEVLVSEALDEVPPELAALIDNVAIFVEDEPPASDPQLLGIYEGIPLTERGHYYGGVLPDRITIYRNPTLAICDTVDDVVDEVNITVVHEIAHHFGIDDARLHELGYG